MLSSVKFNKDERTNVKSHVKNQSLQRELDQLLINR